MSDTTEPGPDVLVAGASGVLGTGLLAVFGDRACALVRGPRDRSIRRLAALSSGDAMTSAHAVEGDVTSPLWGVQDDLAALASTVRTIVNAAAITDWSAPWSALYRTNVVGAVNAVELAAELASRSGQEVRVVHIGSAPSLHGPGGVVPEAPVELSPGAGQYERSKWQAENEVLGRAVAGVTRVIARLTTLVPDAGRRPHPRQQGVARVIAHADRRGWRVVPTHADAVFDAVHVSAAASIVAQLADAPQMPDGTIVNVAQGDAAIPTMAFLSALNAGRATHGLPRFRHVSVPPATLRRVSEVAERFLPLSRHERNLAISLRYFADPRRYARTELTRWVGSELLPAGDLAALVAAHLPLTPGRTQEASASASAFAFFNDA